MGNLYKVSVKTIDIVEVNAQNEQDAIKIVQNTLYNKNPRGIFEVDVVMDARKVKDTDECCSDM